MYRELWQRWAVTLARVSFTGIPSHFRVLISVSILRLWFWNSQFQSQYQDCNLESINSSLHIKTQGLKISIPVLISELRVQKSQFKNFMKKISIVVQILTLANPSANYFKNKNICDMFDCIKNYFNWGFGTRQVKLQRVLKVSIPVLIKALDFWKSQCQSRMQDCNSESRDTSLDIKTVILKVSRPVSISRL